MIFINKDSVSRLTPLEPAYSGDLAKILTTKNLPVTAYTRDICGRHEPILVAAAPAATKQAETRSRQNASAT
jgi:hypothetical protein